MNDPIEEARVDVTIRIVTTARKPPISPKTAQIFSEAQGVFNVRNSAIRVINVIGDELKITTTEDLRTEVSQGIIIIDPEVATTRETIIIRITIRGMTIMVVMDEVDDLSEVVAEVEVVIEVSEGMRETIVQEIMTEGTTMGIIEVKRGLRN